MCRSIAFLRALNVGGRNVRMDVLRSIFEDLGFREVSTFIASGNVIFAAAPGGAEAQEAILARGLEAALGFPVETFLRSAAEVARIARHRAFSESELAEAKALNIGFLKAPLDQGQRQALDGLATDFDDFHLHGREVYWRSKTKQSESKISNALFERKVGVRTTFRTSRTLERLAAKFSPAS